MTAALPPLLLRGDCLVELARIPSDSVDAVVTDPPYGLEFMGKDWDGSDGFRRSLNAADTARESVFGRTSRTSPQYRAGHLFEAWTEQWAAECLRILKPGGHLLAFGGSRTWHRLAAGIEDAGFEMRDSIAWLYGSGFPKSLDVSKAIDKSAGATREVIGKATNGVKGMDAMNLAQGKRGKMYHEEATYDVTAPATSAAREWEGWGTALKPAFEPIVVARKPLDEKTVAANVLRYGTGALNIDASRIAGDVPQVTCSASMFQAKHDGRLSEVNSPGRWPANVILDESQAAALDAQSGPRGAAAPASGPTRTGGSKSSSMAGAFNGTDEAAKFHADAGGASRFFFVAPIETLEERFIYMPKAPKSERPVVDGVAHPTVKPLALARWLCRLVTPPGGVVVDPFAGSGTTLEAAYAEGFESIGVEMTPEYWPLVEARIARVTS